MGRIRRKAESNLGWSREVKRGSWSAAEDQVLRDYIQIHGQGHWEKISKLTGLKRSGKSCRLRWLNYLRPDIKRGNISHDEEELIIRLHNLLGNRWSLIAGRLPGRTDNEIKNYWNSTLRKKLQIQSVEKRISNETDDIIGSSSWDELTMFDINSVSHDIDLSSILHQDHHFDLQAL